MLTVIPRTVVEVDECVERVAAHCGTLGVESVCLSEASGRVLAGDFYSPFPIPSFRRAAMDGYAVQFSDIEQASHEEPVSLQVKDEVKAGTMASAAYPGHAATLRIFTGAPVPEPYDTVIMQEAVIGQAGGGEHSIVQFRIPTERGKHVAQIGEDIREGALVLKDGTSISGKEIAILASFGQQTVEVYRKPTVIVIPVGDELQLPGERLLPHHIFESNGFMIEAKVREIGADSIRYDPVPDDPERIGHAVRSALAQGDIVITIGGVSVGSYDYILPVMEQLATDCLFTKVRMRPGAPTSAYVAGGKLTFHLSGNPSACFNGFELFVKPALRRKSGSKAWRNEMVEAELTDEVGKPSPNPRYIRSFAYVKEGRLYVTPLSGDRSGNVAAFAAANALAWIPAGGKGAAKGQLVRMQWL